MSDLLRRFGIVGMDPDDQSLKQAEAWLGTYYRYKLLSTVGSAIKDRVLPDQDDELARQNARLDIAVKKRQLGMPLSDKDYEQATNEGKSFTSRSLPIFGKHTLQAIPEPGFLSGKHAPFAASSVGDTMKTIFDTTKSADKGASYARRLRSIGHLF